METTPRSEPRSCGTFWGTHGCDLEEGHNPDEAHPIHVCGIGDEEGPHSEARYLTATTTSIQQLEYETGEDDEKGTWSDWETYDNGGLFRMDDKEIR